MEELMTFVLQVEALAGGIITKQDTNGVDTGVTGKGDLNGLSLIFASRTAVDLDPR